MDETSDIVVCRCNVCNGAIEFERQFNGQRATCPQCGMETELYIPAVARTPSPEPQAPPIIHELPIWFGGKDSMVEIRLTSGASVSVHFVRLYDEQKLNDLAKEKAKAAELFQGVTSPFGSIGSIWWVASTYYLTRMIEQSKSLKAAQEGNQLIQKLAQLERQLRADMRFFPIGQIQEIEHPLPTVWRVPPQCGSPGFIHSGDDFLTVKELDGTVHSIRWSAVEYYKYEANRI